MRQPRKRWACKASQLPYRNPARYHSRPCRPSRRNAWKNWRQQERVHRLYCLGDPTAEWEYLLPYHHRHELVWFAD